MGILISEIRIRNYRSLKSVDININDTCLIIGQNNAGKTALLNAINLSLGGTRFASSEDIYVAEGETLPIEREAIIDLMIIPVGEDGDRQDSFSDEWFEHFGDLRNEEPGTLKQFVALRTKIQHNRFKGQYEIVRKALNEWPRSDEVESFDNYNRNSVTEKILSNIPVFYMDAQRDIVSEMKDKRSYFGRIVSDVGLSPEDINNIEEVLSEINDNIIEKSSVLKHLASKLEKVSSTVRTSRDTIKINPISRKIRDLNRGIDISFQDFESEAFPISRHGMGTRSWITFLTLTAYITWKIDVMNEGNEPYHPLILLEEPESHLHPQAQRHVLNQISELSGQKIVSSHSSVIAGQVEIEDIRKIVKKSGISKVMKINTSELDPSDIRKIKREVINTRGDLLFANAIILCEGETEEQSLPVFFKEYFGVNNFEVGINIIGIGGSGKYKPYLRVAKDLCIDYYIFSDGETKTIKKVKKDLKQIFDNDDVDNMDNVVILDNGKDFEGFLIDDGYVDDLVFLIRDIKGEEYLASFIENNNGTETKPQKTSDICPECNQNIYVSYVRDYSGEEGHRKAILECLGNMKTEYSSLLADTLIERQPDNKIPSKIGELFSAVKRDLEDGGRL